MTLRMPMDKIRKLHAVELMRESLVQRNIANGMLETNQVILGGILSEKKKTNDLLDEVKDKLDDLNDTAESIYELMESQISNG